MIRSFQKNLKKIENETDDVEKASRYLHENFANGDMENLKKIYRLLLMFPFSTVLCESSFSHMNQIKNAFRNRMKPQNIEILMFLTLNKNKSIDYKNIAIKLSKKYNF